jgi:hypothetical protein
LHRSSLPQEFKEKFSKLGGNIVDSPLHNFQKKKLFHIGAHEDPAIEPTKQARKGCLTSYQVIYT